MAKESDKLKERIADVEKKLNDPNTDLSMKERLQKQIVGMKQGLERVLEKETRLASSKETRLVSLEATSSNDKPDGSAGETSLNSEFLKPFQTKIKSPKELPECDAYHARVQVSKWLELGFKKGCKTNFMIPFHYPEQYTLCDSPMLNIETGEYHSISDNPKFEKLKRVYTNYFFTIVETVK